MFRPARRPPAPITLQEASGPASPLGDLVELTAGEKLVLLKELRNLIEKRSRVSRPRSMLHTILLSRYLIRDGAAPSQFE
jgi:hypothetical protein